MNFKNIEKAVAKARADFEAIITNTTLDLDVRWDLFSKAPEYLKNKSTYIISIPGIDRKHYLFDAEYRCSEINIIDRVNDWTGDQEWYDELSEEEKQEEYMPVSKEEIRIIKEWALTNNLYAFNWDW